MEELSYRGILQKRRDVFKNQWRPRLFVLDPSTKTLAYYLPSPEGGTSSSSSFDGAATTTTSNSISMENNAPSSSSSSSLFDVVPRGVIELNSSCEVKVKNKSKSDWFVFSIQPTKRNSTVLATPDVAAAAGAGGAGDENVVNEGGIMHSSSSSSSSSGLPCFLGAKTASERDEWVARIRHVILAAHGSSAPTTPETPTPTPPAEEEEMECLSEETTKLPSSAINQHPRLSLKHPPPLNQLLQEQEEQEEASADIHEQTQTPNTPQTTFYNTTTAASLQPTTQSKVIPSSIQPENTTTTPTTATTTTMDHNDQFPLGSNHQNQLNAETFPDLTTSPPTLQKIADSNDHNQNNNQNNNGSNTFTNANPVIPLEISTKINNCLQTFLPYCRSTPSSSSSSSEEEEIHDWKKLFENKRGVTAWQRTHTIPDNDSSENIHNNHTNSHLNDNNKMKKKRRNLPMIKSTCVINHSSCTDVLDLIFDLSKRNEIEPSIKEAKRLFQYNDNQTFLDYYGYQGIWPTKGRDFFIISHWRSMSRSELASSFHSSSDERSGAGDNDQILVAIGLSHVDNNICPPNPSSYVRAEVIVSLCTLEPIGFQGCLLTRILCLDVGIGGTIPQSVAATVVQQQAMLPADAADYLRKMKANSQENDLPTSTSSRRQQQRLTNHVDTPSTESTTLSSLSGNAGRRRHDTTPSSKQQGRGGLLWIGMACSIIVFPIIFSLFGLENDWISFLWIAMSTFLIMKEGIRRLELDMSTTPSSSNRGTQKIGSLHLSSTSSSSPLPSMDAAGIILLTPILSWYIITITTNNTTHNNNNNNNIYKEWLFIGSALWAIRSIIYIVFLLGKRPLPRADVGVSSHGPVTCRFTVDLKGVLRFMDHKKEERLEQQKQQHQQQRQQRDDDDDDDDATSGTINNNNEEEDVRPREDGEEKEMMMITNADISITHIVVKAIAKTLKQMPWANCRSIHIPFLGIYHGYFVDQTIGITVAPSQSSGGGGSSSKYNNHCCAVTLRDVDQMTIQDISNALKYIRQKQQQKEEEEKEKEEDDDKDENNNNNNNLMSEEEQSISILSFFSVIITRLFTFFSSSATLGILQPGEEGESGGACVVYTSPNAENSEVDIEVSPSSSSSSSSSSWFNTISPSIYVVVGGVRGITRSSSSSRPVLGITITMNCPPCSLAASRRFAERVQRFVQFPELCEEES